MDHLGQTALKNTKFHPFSFFLTPTISTLFYLFLSIPKLQQFPPQSAKSLQQCLQRRERKSPHPSLLPPHAFSSVTHLLICGATLFLLSSDTKTRQSKERCKSEGHAHRLIIKQHNHRPSDNKMQFDFFLFFRKQVCFFSFKYFYQNSRISESWTAEEPIRG